MIELPTNKPSTPRNIQLVDIYNRMGEFVNIALARVEEGFIDSFYFAPNLDWAVDDAKESVERIRDEILELPAVEDGEDVFQLPTDLADSLAYHSIKWPPIQAVFRS